MAWNRAEIDEFAGLVGIEDKRCARAFRLYTTGARCILVKHDIVFRALTIDEVNLYGFALVNLERRIDLLSRLLV
jgi:hypothetical protein